MPRLPTVMGVQAGAPALRPCASLLSTLLVLLLLLLALEPGVAGNQERLLISERLSLCLSS